MEGGLNYAHLFPRVSRYKRGSDIVDVRVYMKLTKIIYSNTLMELCNYIANVFFNGLQS
jgi:hypothetical protein